MRENYGNATECFSSQMSKHSAFVLLECHLMLLLLEDNVLLSHFHASRAGISCLHYGIFQAHQIHKFQSSFSLLLSEVQKTRAWFVLLSGDFSYQSWKFQGKGLWLEWKWRVNFPGFKPGFKPRAEWPWQRTLGKSLLLGQSNAMLYKCNTYSKEEKRGKKVDCGKKKGGEEEERCSYTLKYFWKQMLLLIYPAAWKLCYKGGDMILCVHPGHQSRMRAEPSYGAPLSPFLNSRAVASLTFPVDEEVKQCWLTLRLSSSPPCCWLTFASKWQS